MNKENAHLFLPLVQALADGKSIQFKNCFKGKSGHWEDFEDGEPVQFWGHPEEYRIKPEPRTFEVVISKMNGSIYNAKEWDGTSPNIWERITVQEVLK